MPETLTLASFSKPVDEPMSAPQKRVKCVVKNNPWTKDKTLSYWEDYVIDADDAVLMESNRQIVILGDA